jgi:hypothetical protein
MPIAQFGGASAARASVKPSISAVVEPGIRIVVFTARSKFFRWGFLGRKPSAILVLRRGGGGRRKRRPMETTTVIIIGIVLSFVGLAYLCWIVFSLAVHALPFYCGVAAGITAYHTGSGPIAAIIVGVVAGGIVLAIAQIGFASLRSPAVRILVALIFAVPAAMAGYHAALGLAYIVVPVEGWREAIAITGAIAVAGTAVARMALLAPRNADRALPRA